MGFTMMAVAAVGAVNQISQGYAQQREMKYNAQVKENQASMVDLQSEIEQGQYDRKKAQYMSKSTANLAAAGIMPGGSSAAVMLDAQTQINIDQAIAKFNKTQEKNYLMDEASAYRRAGKQAVRSAYTNAFSTMLQGGANAAMYSGGAPRTSVGTQRNTTFDAISPMPGTGRSRANTQGLTFS